MESHLAAAVTPTATAIMIIIVHTATTIMATVTTTTTTVMLTTTTTVTRTMITFRTTAIRKMKLSWLTLHFMLNRSICFVSAPIYMYVIQVGQICRRMHVKMYTCTYVYMC